MVRDTPPFIVTPPVKPGPAVEGTDAVNVAVTAALALSKSVQGEVPVQPLPDQPVNT